MVGRRGFQNLTLLVYEYIFVHGTERNQDSENHESRTSHQTDAAAGAGAEEVPLNNNDYDDDDILFTKSYHLHALCSALAVSNSITLCTESCPFDTAVRLHYAVAV